MSNETHVSGGLGFTSILTLIFVVCKLMHYIDWSWWWVFAPVLISTGLAIFIVLAVLIVGILVAVTKS